MLAWLCLLLLLLGIAVPPPEPGPAQRVPPGRSDLDRIAQAVEAAESGFGANKAMWRPNPAGPQGPMQVSAAAAVDVGNGNRFDPDDNRRIGRAYLALLYQRYGNWTDAVIAYNWGPGNVDRWRMAGRPANDLSGALWRYVDRVMREFIAAPPKALPGTRSAEPGPTETPIADIKNPGHRKTYLANRAMVAELRGVLAGAAPADRSSTDADAIIDVIRRVSARPGYQEFARLRAARLAAPAAQPALRQIASVLIDKLQSECAAIVAIDHRRGGTGFKGPAHC